MTPASTIKLVSELLDLPLLDSDGKYCGIVDDIELTGAAGRAMNVIALLVGPGAYAGRLPKLMMWLVRTTVGNRIVRVPLAKVRTITSVVHLDCPGSEIGLRKSEARAARWIPRKGAL
jgi:sporulation protein YlmC with PRC-barrel domain